MTYEGFEFTLRDIQYLLKNGKVEQALLCIEASLTAFQVAKATPKGVELKSFPSTSFNEEEWRKKWEANPELQRFFNANKESSIVFRPQDQTPPANLDAGQPYLLFVMVPE